MNPSCATTTMRGEGDIAFIYPVQARSAREPELALCSFDMLGEGARTRRDAVRYLESYEHAIDVIGAAVRGRRKGKGRRVLRDPEEFMMEPSQGDGQGAHDACPPA